MNRSRESIRGFTLLEMLVVIAIVALLAAMVLPVLGGARKRAQIAVCTNNLRQINLGIRLYADDSRDAPPSPGAAAAVDPLLLYSGYKSLMKGYLAGNDKPLAANPLFSCPADQFYPAWIFATNVVPAGQYVRSSLHDEPFLDYSSYVFNGGNNQSRTNRFEAVVISRPGLTGVRLTDVKHPSRTALVSEGSAPCPWSWHAPSTRWRFNDARNLVSFVDGHVSYIKIYWDAAANRGNSQAFMYDPPAGYDYQWSPN